MLRSHATATLNLKNLSLNTFTHHGLTKLPNPSSTTTATVVHRLWKASKGSCKQSHQICLCPFDVPRRAGAGFWDLPVPQTLRNVDLVGLVPEVLQMVAHKLASNWPQTSNPKSFREPCKL